MLLEKSPCISKTELRESIPDEYTITDCELDYETDDKQLADAGGIKESGIVKGEENICSIFTAYSNSIDSENRELVRLEWNEYPNDRIAYIVYIYVDSNERRNGIASSVRKRLLTALNRSPTYNTVYSYPISEAGKYLAKDKHEFTRDNNQPPDEDWLYKTV